MCGRWQTANSEMLRIKEEAIKERSAEADRTMPAAPVVARIVAITVYAKAAAWSALGVCSSDQYAFLQGRSTVQAALIKPHTF